MTDREKLIALLEDARTEVETICELSHCSECPGGMACDNGIVANYLLANGVTFATDTNVGGKWIPVTERLPERDDVVIAFYETMRETTAAIQIHKAWAMTGSCTHWMPLPEPPKED